MADTHFKPTLRMASAARRGLRLHDRFGRGGTPAGIARARQLAGRHLLDAADVKSMHSFFARHEVDKQGKEHQWDSDSDPSAGFIAWLLWGGNAGKLWAEGKVRKLG